ncbi:hypothetical protein [Blastochloris tepida]|nr:hypothetical protein [Blastochloris tepida]
MLEQRVTDLERGVQRLEARFEAVTGALQRIEVALRDLSGLRGEMSTLKTDLRSDFAGLKTDLKTEIAEIKGKVSMLPTWWMLLVGMVAILGTGAAIVRFL